MLYPRRFVVACILPRLESTLELEVHLPLAQKQGDEAPLVSLRIVAVERKNLFVLNFENHIELKFWNEPFYYRYESPYENKI